MIVSPMAGGLTPDAEQQSLSPEGVEGIGPGESDPGPAEIGTDELGLPGMPELASTESVGQRSGSSQAASDRGSPSGPRITTVAFDEPWEEQEATTVGVFVDNNLADPPSVFVDTSLRENNTTAARSISAPVQLHSGVGQWINVTMSAPHGAYDLAVELNSAEDPTGTLDQETEEATVTLPLGLPPSSYVRVVSNGTERPALPSETSSNETQISIEPTSGTEILVYKPWLEHEFGSVTSPVEWTSVKKDTGPWVRVAVGDQPGASFSTFDPSSDRVYTNGDARHVGLLDRPMWVDVLEQRPAFEPAGEANATAPVDASPRLVVDFEDGDRKGQTLEFGIHWLQRLGFSHPQFHYADGTEIPTTFTGSSYVVEAPHFSSVYVDDADCDCRNETPPDWWYPTPPAEGVQFYVSNAVATSAPHSIKAKGADWDEEHLRATKTLPAVVKPDAIRFEGYVGDKNGTDPHFHILRFRDVNANTLLSVNLLSQDATTLHVKTGGTEYTQDFPMETWLTIEATNIDWNACTYDLTVEGTTLDTGISLGGGTCSDGISQVLDKSKKWNAEPWWFDDLRFDEPNLLEDFNAPGYLNEKPPGWTRDSVGKAYQIDDTHATEGTYALKAHGGSSGTHARGQKALDTFPQPSSIAFDAYIGAHSGGSDDNRHLVAFGSGPALRAKLMSVSGGDVRVETINSGGGVATFPHQTWTTVRFSNIDWTSCDYDVEVAGSTVATGLSFDCSSIDEVIVNSKGWGSEPMWVDHIRYQGGAPSDPTPAPPYSEAFDDGSADGWDLSGLWHVDSDCSTPPSTPNYLGYHRTSACDYDTGSTTSGFATFTVDLTGVSAAELSFEDRKETEELSSYDHMWIDYDDGSGWTNLVSYNSSANQLSWTGHTLSLNNAVGNIVDIRFGFDSEDNVNNAYDGWYVDNVQVTEGASNSPPSATWGSTKDGLTINTDASLSSDPDGDSLTYEWDWGDGSTDTDNDPFNSHTYDVCPSGTFTIGLTVYDGNGGSDTSSQTHTLEQTNDDDNDQLVQCREDLQGTSDTNQDTDGDQLTDWNESQWFPNRDQIFCSAGCTADKYPAPLQKDVYVEMDYMTPINEHLPSNATLDEIVAVYDQAPHINNPDGSSGLRIHLDAGPARADRFNLGRGNSMAHEEHLGTSGADCTNYDWTEFENAKSDNMSSDRDHLFHYNIWAHDLAVDCGSTSGYSQGIPADDFIVSLGGWSNHGDQDTKKGTWIHELGHNLGLSHGGFENQNYKPNYLSVMNYAFQTGGIPRADNGDPYFGYSETTYPDLDESDLDETVGLDHPAAETYRTSWWCGSGNSRSEVTSANSANDTVDWNCNGIDDLATHADISDDEDQSGCTSLLDDAECDVLQGYRDWGNLEYHGGSGDDRIGPGTTATLDATSSSEMPQELTWEEQRRMDGDT